MYICTHMFVCIHCELSPASYRYYKMELKNGATFSGKGGSGYVIQVYGLQFIGIVT